MVRARPSDNWTVGDQSKAREARLMSGRRCLEPSWGGGSKTTYDNPPTLSSTISARLRISTSEVTHINRSGKVCWRGHHSDKTFDEIVHETKVASLRAIAIDCDVLSSQRLDNEVANDPAIVGVHAWALSIEDPNDPDLQTMLPVVIE